MPFNIRLDASLFPMAALGKNQTHLSWVPACTTGTTSTMTPALSKPSGLHHGRRLEIFSPSFFMENVTHKKRNRETRIMTPDFQLTNGQARFTWDCENGSMLPEPCDPNVSSPDLVGPPWARHPWQESSRWQEAGRAGALDWRDPRPRGKQSHWNTVKPGNENRKAARSTQQGQVTLTSLSSLLRHDDGATFPMQYSTPKLIRRVEQCEKTPGKPKSRATPQIIQLSTLQNCQGHEK